MADILAPVDKFDVLMLVVKMQTFEWATAPPLRTVPEFGTEHV